MFGEIVSSVISETRCITKTGYPCELGRPGVRRVSLGARVSDEGNV